MNSNSNRLISEKSPYLLQHAYNPVNWYPWSEEAFAKAKQENKPVFLSVGYSTCHWCHVMAHESFEDHEVAELMNETFISIKVDREERPDIDAIYTAACINMTGGGGWPLNIVMTPDKEPFYAATYIPKIGWFGRVGMLTLIPRIKEMWLNEKTKLLNTATQIVSSLHEVKETAGSSIIDVSFIHTAYKQLSKQFDEQHGGFGNAPKFLMPHSIMFLLRYWKRTGEERALNMSEKTLQAMIGGGIYDHIGFGFHRYSTDSRWLVPHFEKMLYDQALMAMACIETYQATGKEEYAIAARETITYVIRDMYSLEGGFYSAEDADIEGEEGKYYLWTLSQLEKVLNKKQLDLAVRVFNVTKEGNFIDQATGKKNGRNIIYLSESIDNIASDLAMEKTILQDQIEKIRKTLFICREKRVRPNKDDKILTDWNGLMIAALARASQVFGDMSYERAANQSARFIIDRMKDSRGRLLHRYREGEGAIAAYIDDYAFLIYGLLELYEVDFRVEFLEHALDLNEQLMNHFWDNEKGGFYFTADDTERMLLRQKEIHDGAVPSGNSVAILNLLRLGNITGNPDFKIKAEMTGRTFHDKVSQMPAGYTQLMSAIDFAIGPCYQVIIAGRKNSADTGKMLKAIRRIFLPNKTVILRPNEMVQSYIDKVLPHIKQYSQASTRATAYICLDDRCQLPTTDIDTMVELISTK